MSPSRYAGEMLVLRLLPAAAPDYTERWPDWTKWLIDKPLQIAIIIVAALLLIAVCHRVVTRIVKRVVRASDSAADSSDDGEPGAALRLATRAKTAKSVLNSVTTVAIVVIAIVLVLERLGVNVAVLVASLGVAGVGLGLGAQTLIKDWIAGLFMMLEDQYGIGDEIDAGPASGRVVHVTLRMTTIEDADGAQWHIPHSTITRIGNKTQTAPRH